MLVLSRKETQQLKIGDNVTITVLEVKGNIVRIGIDAPPGVRILRGELQAWVERPKNITAGETSPPSVAV